MRTGPLLLSLVMVCAGCAAKQPTSRATTKTKLDLANAFNGGIDRQLSADPQKVHHLDVYQLALPLGAVSRSEALGTLQSPAQVAERPCARHVRDALEVPGRRR